MRIALVVQGGADRSGRERVVPALLWQLERLARSHEVHVFALRHEAAPGHYPLLGAEVHDLGGALAHPALGLAQLFPRLLSWLRRHGPFDVIHAYRGGAPGFLAAIAARVLGTPLVLTLDGGELVGLPEIGYGLQLRWRDRSMLAAAARTARIVTVCSPYMRRLAEAAGLSVRELPLGVDAAAFGPAAAGPGPPWRLLSVGHLNAVKDPWTLLRAMRRVIDHESEARLDVVGLDTLGSQVQGLARELGLADHVTFHGLQSADRMPGLYRGCHLLVQASRHEAGPVAVLEAAACGIATVGTAVGYLAAWSPERASAVPVGDPGALASETLSLLRDTCRREELAGRARAWALSHDADWTTARLSELYAGAR